MKTETDRSKSSARVYLFMLLPSLVPRRSLLLRCPREVGVYLSVTSQLTVKSRIDRAENA